MTRPCVIALCALALARPLAAQTPADTALYTRLGYIETSREPFGGLTIVHMRKAIQGAG